MFWWKRYEPLLEAKATPVKDALVDLLAKELVEMCQTFPPEERSIEWQDASLERRFGGRLAELPRPDEALVAHLAQLIAWDLENEPEAISHFFRNEQWGDACPTRAHVDALHLLWRVGVELLLTRKEEARQVLKRSDLVAAARKLPDVFRKKEAINVRDHGVA